MWKISLPIMRPLFLLAKPRKAHWATPSHPLKWIKQIVADLQRLPWRLPETDLLTSPSEPQRLAEVSKKREHGGTNLLRHINYEGKDVSGFPWITKIHSFSQSLSIPWMGEHAERLSHHGSSASLHESCRETQWNVTQVNLLVTQASPLGTHRNSIKDSQIV